ncbi:MAG: DEAD/DEAH box helicase, partial [Eubacteriales bacterium]
MLYDSVTNLSGVGKVRAQQLAQLNIHTLFDLISHFPRAYEDRTKFVDMDQLVVDEPACFKAIVVSGPRTNYLRKGLDITKAMVSDNTAQIGITFFNNPYVVSSLSYGKEYCFYGKLSGDYKGYQIVSPDFEPVQFMGTVTNRILPIYPLTAGITNKSMVKLVAQAFACCGEELTDLLPLELQAQYDICSTAFAYANIHNPASFDDLEKAKSRLIFEEFFVFSLGLQMVRTKRQAKSRMPLSPVEMSPFYNALGFVLTGAQKRTIEEILTSFSQPTAMNRLVQGDVGSGKTAVAAAATFAVASNGGQVAFMAPTEILAEQHHRALSALFAPL